MIRFISTEVQFTAACDHCGRRVTMTTHDDERPHLSPYVIATECMEDLGWHAGECARCSNVPGYRSEADRADAEGSVERELAV